MNRKIPVTTGGQEPPLTSNPFSQLLGAAPENLPEMPAPLPVKTTTPKIAPVFRVAKTKKGGYPVFLEKRAAGKTVTIIRNVTGDADALSALLKKRCAAGGKAFADSVEIQGDHREKVEAFLREQAL